MIKNVIFDIGGILFDDSKENLEKPLNKDCSNIYKIAYGKEFKDIVKKVTVLNEDGNIQELKNAELGFTYRNSIFSVNKSIVIEAELVLQKGNMEEIKEKMNEYLNSRKEKQPLEYPSAGSTFKRGDGYITAKLIDECGLKGYQIGGAQVSEKHCGFVVNLGNAKAKDILDLMYIVKSTVKSKYGITLEEEVKILGED